MYRQSKQQFTASSVSDIMNTNTGLSNSAPFPQRMNVEEYKRINFEQTKVDLEKRRLEGEQAALQSHQQGRRDA